VSSRARSPIQPGTRCANRALCACRCARSEATTPNGRVIDRVGGHQVHPVRYQRLSNRAKNHRKGINTRWMREDAIRMRRRRVSQGIAKEGEGAFVLSLSVSVFRYISGGVVARIRGSGPALLHGTACPAGSEGASIIRRWVAWRWWYGTKRRRRSSGRLKGRL